MVLQNESADEDLEHFDDIVEETENQTSTKVEEPENNSGTVHTNNSIDSDNDSSQDEGVPPTSESEDDVSDEADDLFIGGDSKNVEETNTMQETNTMPDQTKQPSQVSKMSSLPGGYNPRHREPSYWYLHLLLLHLNMCALEGITQLLSLHYEIIKPCIPYNIMALELCSNYLVNFCFTLRQQCTLCKLVGAYGTGFTCAPICRYHGPNPSFWGQYSV